MSQYTTYEEYFREMKKEMQKQRMNEHFRRTPEEALQYANEKIKKYNSLVKQYPPHLPDEVKPIQAPFLLPHTLRSTIISMLLGQAVGDAIGLATEFLDKPTAQAFYKGEHIRYDHYLIDSHRARWMNKDWHCADWTDDTDQCLLILDSIVRNNGECNAADFTARLYYWLHFGYTEVGDISPLGLGAHTSKVTSTDGWLQNPIEVAKKVWIDGGKKSAANGSVMRTSVASIPYFWDEKKVVENARIYGLITHPDNRCQASVTTIVLILAKLLQGRADIETMIEEAVDIAIKDIPDLNQREDFYKYVYARSLDELDLGRSIGYTFKPVGCAILSLQLAAKMLKEGKEKKAIFTELVENIAYEGGDADTNLAVVGAVLGAYLKDFCIPTEWLEFDNKQWLVERINGVLRLYGLQPFALR